MGGSGPVGPTVQGVKESGPKILHIFGAEQCFIVEMGDNRQMLAQPRQAWAALSAKQQFRAVLGNSAV